MYSVAAAATTNGDRLVSRCSTPRSKRTAIRKQIWSQRTSGGRGGGALATAAGQRHMRHHNARAGIGCADTAPLRAGARRRWGGGHSNSSNALQWRCCWRWRLLVRFINTFIDNLKFEHYNLRSKGVYHWILYFNNVPDCVRFFAYPTVYSHSTVQ